jgi:hypothetical protein
MNRQNVTKWWRELCGGEFDDDGEMQEEVMTFEG